MFCFYWDSTAHPILETEEVSCLTSEWMTTEPYLLKEYREALLALPSIVMEAEFWYLCSCSKVHVNRQQSNVLKNNLANIICDPVLQT